MSVPCVICGASVVNGLVRKVCDVFVCSDCQEALLAADDIEIKEEARDEAR
jgi:hypothetical protein